METNELRFCVRCACVGSTTLFVTGSIFQTFLVSYGVPAEQVSRMTAVMSSTQMVTILCMSLVTDSLKRVKRDSAASIGLMAVYFLALVPLLLAGVGPETLARAMLAAGMLQNVLLGVYSILEFKLPYWVIDMRNYARLSAVSGAFAGGAQICVAGMATFLLSRFRSGRAMAGLFGGCILLALIGALETMRLRENGRGEAAPAHGGLRVLRMPAFRALLGPNLMRGFNSGVVNMLVVIGMHELGLTVEQGASMAIVFTVMSIVVAFLYGRLSKRFASRRLCLTASVVVAAALPGLLLTGGGMAFMAVYVVVLGAVFMVDYSVPVIVTEIVPYDCMGGFSSMRLGAHWAGISLGAWLVGICLPRGFIFPLLAVSAAMQLTSGVVYYVFSGKHSLSLM